MNPSGHIQPQVTLPKITANRKIEANVIQGITASESIYSSNSKDPVTVFVELSK
jgi:subtilisin-like proprotein convertase family protein